MNNSTDQIISNKTGQVNEKNKINERDKNLFPEKEEKGVNQSAATINRKENKALETS